MKYLLVPDKRRQAAERRRRLERRRRRVETGVSCGEGRMGRRARARREGKKERAPLCFLPCWRWQDEQRQQNERWRERQLHEDPPGAHGERDVSKEALWGKCVCVVVVCVCVCVRGGGRAETTLIQSIKKKVRSISRLFKTTHLMFPPRLALESKGKWAADLALFHRFFCSNTRYARVSIFSLPP